MIFKPNLNIVFYFIQNGSWMWTANTFGHVKLNLKLSLFQNLDLEYSLSPVVVPRSELSISLFCTIPKSKILTKKKLWSRGSMPRKAALLSVQYGRFEVLSNPKTLYVQWTLLGQKNTFQQRRKTKPTDEDQILSTHEGSFTMRKLKLHHLVPLGPMWGSMHSLKWEEVALRDCMLYAFFIGALGFGFWVKIQSLFRGWVSPKALTLCSSIQSLKIRHQSLGSGRSLNKWIYLCKILRYARVHGIYSRALDAARKGWPSSDWS